MPGDNVSITVKLIADRHGRRVCASPSREGGRTVGAGVGQDHRIRNHHAKAEDPHSPEGLRLQS